MHPRYDHRTLDYDIALLRLSDPIMAFTQHVKPVCLPPSDYVLPIGQNCTVTGFGRVGKLAWNIITINKWVRVRVRIKKHHIYSLDLFQLSFWTYLRLHNQTAIHHKLFLHFSLFTCYQQVLILEDASDHFLFFFAPILLAYLVSASTIYSY